MHGKLFCGHSLCDNYSPARQPVNHSASYRCRPDCMSMSGGHTPHAATPTDVALGCDIVHLTSLPPLLPSIRTQNVRLKMMEISPVPVDSSTFHEVTASPGVHALRRFLAGRRGVTKTAFLSKLQSHCVVNLLVTVDRFLGFCLFVTILPQVRLR